MYKSICDIREHEPAFVTLEAQLIDKLGPEKGTYEAARDYLEYQEVRPFDDVLDKLKDEIFSPYAEILKQSNPAKAPVTVDSKKASVVAEPINKEALDQFKAEVKLNKKEVSGLQKAMINKRVVKANGKLATSFYIKYKQVGQADLYTWEVLDYGKKNQQVIAFNRQELLAARQVDFDNKELTSAETTNTRAIEIATKLADTLSGQTGIAYKIINEKEAKEITKDAKNPWVNEPAFYVGSTVYFVGNNLTTKNALHEFSHPIFRAISVSNQELFKNLYNDLIKTNEGARIVESVKQNYPDLDINDNLFAEEVLVHALQSVSEDKRHDVKEPKGFAKAIQNILYSIKQFLRKVFGQPVNVANLDVDTTLDQLADMLAAGKNFDIKTDLVNQDDVTAYVRDNETYINDLLKIDKAELEALTNSFFDKVSKQIQKVKNNENYADMLNLLVNEYKTGELQKMRENLKPYQTKILERMDALTDEVEYQKRSASALLNTMFRLQNLTEKVREQLVEISKDVDNKDNLQRAFYYKQLLDYWDDFTKEADENLSKVFIDVNSPLSRLVGQLGQSIKRSYDVIDSIYQKGSKDILMDELSSSAKKIDEKYTEMLATLRTKNAPQNIIDKLNKEYEEAKITPDKIEKALKGQLKDANAISSFLEGYGYNTDPVVGGLALYVKNNMTDVLIKSQRKFNDFADEMKPLLEAVGYNPNNVGELGKQIGYKDKVGYTDENGDFKVREVWRFLNKFKGSDLVEDEYRYKIKTASDKYAESGSEEDKKALYDLQSEWKNHRTDYWHQEYVPQFYERYNLLEKDDIGKEAAMLRDNVYDEMRQLTESPTSAMDDLQVSDQLEELHRQLRHLKDVRDEGGRMKTGKDLAIAERLKEFDEATKDFYEWKEIPDAFKNALSDFEQKLVSEGYEKGSDQYKLLREAWLEKNTRRVAKQEFWDEMGSISTKIKDLLSKLPVNEQANLDISGALQEIKEVMTGYKDGEGQPVGDEMDPERLEIIKRNQEKIMNAQDKLAKLSGLTKAEQFELNEIYDRLAFGQANNADRQRLQVLMDRKSALSLDKFQRAALAGLFEQMNQLRKREATDSYVDTMNSWLSTLKTDRIHFITRGNANIILQEHNINDLLAQSAEFETWFKQNHIRKKGFDKEAGEEIERWERTYAWNVIRPNDDAYYEKTAITDDEGNVVEEVIGIPASKYFKRIVKDEYRNDKIVGKTVDNRGNWLPKGLEDGAKDDRYINQDYFKMQRDNPNLFKVLEKMKQHHLENQEGVSKKGRLYLDMPRFRKQTVERLQSTNLLQRLIQRLKDFWNKVKDGYESGFNFKDDYQLVKLDMFDDDTTGVPISGLSNLDVEEVSTDIAYNMMRYMLSAERQKKLVEISPAARAIQSVLNNKKNFPFAEKALNNNTILVSDKKKNKYIRAQAVNNMIERDFEGQANTGWFSDSAPAQNFSNFLFKKASFAYLAFNIPSALKNAISAKFQGMVEAIAGKYMTPQTYAKGEGWAVNAAGKISMEVYKKGSKSLDLQIIEIFDPEQGRYEHKVGEALSRTPGKDTFLMIERLSDFRKWTQLQSSLHIFAGMMYHQKVKQGEKYIDYMSAWELKDGKIQLKPGVDPEWGITYDQDGKELIGAKFKEKRNEIHTVMANLNGAMSREESPEANRYLLFRYISYLRRWFTTMFTNRWAYSGSLWRGSSRGRVNYQLGDTKEGWYISTLKLIGKAAMTGGKYLPYMNQDEKQAFIRVMTEVGTLILMSSLLPLMFDWDPDDEDRYARLRAKSGALPFFGLTAEDPKRPFNIGGYLENHALLMMMNIRGENEQFLPFPGFGLDDYSSYMDIKSLAFGPTTKSYAKVAQDMYYIASGDDKAYYKRTVGPYEFQQEGGSKAWAHLATAIGLTGGSIDPAVAIKNFQANQARSK